MFLDIKKEKNFRWKRKNWIEAIHVSYELYIFANAFLILMISIVHHKKENPSEKWHYKQHENFWYEMQ